MITAGVVLKCCVNASAVLAANHFSGAAGADGFGVLFKGGRVRHESVALEQDGAARLPIMPRRAVVGHGHIPWVTGLIQMGS